MPKLNIGAALDIVALNPEFEFLKLAEGGQELFICCNYNHCEIIVIATSISWLCKFKLITNKVVYKMNEIQVK